MKIELLAKRHPRVLIVSAFLDSVLIPALLVLGFLTTDSELQAGETQAQFSLTASPRVIDEGELIEFGMENLLYIDSETGESLEMAVSLGEIDWNFEDGSGGQRGATLFWVNHRFIDDQLSEYAVRAHYAGGQASITVRVNNVPPEIRSLWHSRPALKEQPVTFDASATDPGLEDQLTFTWDFGDGNTATGEQVEHTYAADGTYHAMLVVDDGDGGEDTQDFQVLVGAAGSFTVSGDVSLPTIGITQLILAGSTRNPLAENTGDACQLRLTMGDAASATSFTLTANLKPGFGVRDYAIGNTTEWDGMHENDIESQGTFFADLSLPRDISIRNFDGMKISGPFWSESGSVSVHHFDGKYLELSFEAQVVENVAVEYQPRVVQVSGTLGTLVERSAGGVLTGLGNFFSASAEALNDPEATGTAAGANFYLCGVDESKTFDIEQHLPAANAVNTEFLNPHIEISFTEAVDPATIRDNVRLEFRATSGFELIPGSWQPVAGDPKTIQFIPQAHLLDGVIYCVRVDTEEDGIRGREGEKLTGSSQDYSSTNAAACKTGSSASPGGTREFAFATRPELSSARVDLYQVSVADEHTPLVAGKPTVARVYPSWSGQMAAHRLARVKEFPARVTVKRDTQPVYPPRREMVKLPSEFTAEDTRRARNSINFFGWRPDSPSGNYNHIHAELELLDENNAVVGELFKGQVTTTRVWDRKPELKVDFRMIAVDGKCEEAFPCNWSDEIEPVVRQFAHETMLEGAEFTTQNFPVVRTIARKFPDLEIWEPPSGDCWINNVGGDCYLGGPLLGDNTTSGYVARKLYQAGKDSDADVLVGFVPPGFLDKGAGGRLVNLEDTATPGMGRRVILYEIGVINAVGFAHEIGHHFGLSHCPEVIKDANGQVLSQECTPARIQGFRVDPSGQSGFNKHHLEGNQQASDLKPLMHWFQQEDGVGFISTTKYLSLFNAVAFAAPWTQWHSPRAPLPQQPSLLETLFLPASAHAQDVHGQFQDTLDISGVAHSGKIFIQRVMPSKTPLERLAHDHAGPYTLDLLDGSGGVLRSVPFALNEVDQWHGEPVGAHQFRLTVEAPKELQSLRVTGPGGIKAERTRSANPPQVSAHVSANSTDGSRTIAWTANDADNGPGGEELRTDIYIRAENDEPWQGVAIGIQKNELTIPADQLPPGASISAKIVVSDGFNSSSTELDLGPGSPLSVLATIPKNDEKDVALRSDIIAWISNPLKTKISGTDPIQLPANQFSLADTAGKPVMADAFYLPAESIITLVPVEPLMPESRYTASVLTLTDRWDNPLDKPHSWSFETEAGEQLAFSEAGDDLASPRKISTKRAFPPKEPVASPGATSASRPAAPGQGSGTNSVLNSSTSPAATPSSECSCACDKRSSADELCELFCEEEFALCSDPK